VFKKKKKKRKEENDHGKTRRFFSNGGIRRSSMFQMIMAKRTQISDKVHLLQRSTLSNRIFIEMEL
jgi:hypothetical protein